MKKLGLLLTGAMFGLIFSSVAEAKPITLRFQSLYSPTHVGEVQGVAPWVDEVNAKGKDIGLTIERFPMDSIVKGTEARSAMQNGILDMTCFGPPQEPKMFPYFTPTSLPFLTDNAADAIRVAWDMYTNDPVVKKELDASTKVITMWTGADAAFFSINTAIRTPADLKGKRVLVLVPSSIDIVKAWGGTPVQVGGGDLYVGLQRGMGEVYFGQIPFGFSLKLGELAKYITVIRTDSPMTVLGMNNDTYKILSPEQKAIIDSYVGIDLGLKITEIMNNDTERALKEYAASGREVIYLDETQLDVFKKSLDEVIKVTWVNNLKAYGIKDPQKVIDATYKLAETISAQNN